MSQKHLWFLAIFLAGALIRMVNVWRPVDTLFWRESDLAGIARNYDREGMNLLYPRVDWRGDGPGYAEMEFPIYPWLIAVGYRIAGPHEEIGRLLSFGFSLLTLAAFICLARDLLPDPGAVAASTFFALSPLTVYVATAIRPESLMVLGYLTAVWAFLRWLQTDSWKHYSLSVCATGLAVLAKAPTAHLGLLFAAVILWVKGLGCLRRKRTWLFGVVALSPAALWYSHAYQLWTTYGNSLGLSNRNHWAGWEVFTNPVFLDGIVRIELWQVWMPAGLALAVVGAVCKWRSLVVRVCLCWLAVLGVYYLLTARTTSESWAFYYHVVSVAPAALLVGTGVEAVWEQRMRARVPWALALVLVSFSGISIALGSALASDAWRRSGLVLVGGAVLLLLAAWLQRRGGNAVEQPSFWRPIALSAALVLVAATGFSEVRRLRPLLAPRQMPALYHCAQRFAKAIPSGALIVASGAGCTGAQGYPIGYNTPFMFYWLDRKGFNICQDEQSVDALRELAERKARYFVAQKGAMDAKPGFEAEVRRAFPVVEECDEAVLFDLLP